jgi:diguanylate cyclase (GGDEF)-like protein
MIWIALLALTGLAATAGYLSGRRAAGSPGAPAWVPRDHEFAIELVRRANRALAGVVVSTGGTLSSSTHPRGVPRAVVERCGAVARLVLADGRPQVVRQDGVVVAAGGGVVAAALAFDDDAPGHQVDRAVGDLQVLTAELEAAGSARLDTSPAGGRWDDDEAKLTVHETVAGAAGALVERIRRTTGRPTALAIRDDLAGDVRVLAVSTGSDRRLVGTSALPGSAAARAVGGDAPVPAASGAELFGTDLADRRRFRSGGLVFPVHDGREGVGALIVFGAPAALPPDLRSQIHRLLEIAAPRLAHLRDVHVREVRVRTDELTGLPNRRGLERAMAGAAVGQASLLLLDVDHFKRLNDTHGHVAGDAGLRHLGSVLRRGLREGDVAARIGGEEFALWLPDTALEAALEVAERVRSAVEATPLRWQGAEIPMTCSVGVSTYPEIVGAVVSLYPAADAALYRAKRGGRNRVTVAYRGEHAVSADPDEDAARPAGLY